MSVENDVVDQITRRFPAELILLFGSRARGDARPDSDWDFLVVMPTAERPAKRTLRVRQWVRQLESVRGIPIDIVVRTPGEMQQGFPLSKEILREGKVLYRAPGR